MPQNFLFFAAPYQKSREYTSFSTYSLYSRFASFLDWFNFNFFANLNCSMYVLKLPSLVSLLNCEDFVFIQLNPFFVKLLLVFFSVTYPELDFVS